MIDYNPRVGDFVWLYHRASLTEYGLEPQPAVISRIHPMDKEWVDIEVYTPGEMHPRQWTGIKMVKELPSPLPKSRFAFWPLGQCRHGNKRRLFDGRDRTDCWSYRMVFC